MPDSTESLFSAQISRRTLLAAGGLGALVFLTGCQLVSRSSTPASTPRRGGIFIIGQNSDVLPTSLARSSQQNFGIHRLLFNTLTEYDRPRLVVKPALASSWKLSADRLAMTLELRSDVKFHTGRDFVADDVVFAVKTMQDVARNANMRNTALLVSDVSVDGPHTVTLKLKQPISNIFDFFEWMPIFDKDTFADLLTGKNVVGTGPFMWKTWTPNDSLVLVKNPNYWKPDQPFLDGVQIRVIPQNTSLLAALQTKQVHMVIEPSPKDLGPFKNNKDFVLDNDHVGDSAYYVSFNVKVPPLDQKEVRQAIAYAIDGKRILDQVFQGYGVVTSLPWPKQSPAYNAALNSRFAYNPDKAKAMLAAAGVKNLKLPMASNTGIPATVDMATIVQSNLADVGIEAVHTQLSSAQTGAATSSGSWQGIMVGPSGFTQVQPVTLMTASFPFQAAKNASNYVDPNYVALANRAWIATNDQELKSAYNDVSNLLLDSVFLTTVILYSRQYLRLSSATDVRYDMTGYVNLDDAYFA